MTRKLVYLVLKILHKLGIIDKIWSLDYSGKIFSLNDLYKQGHWAIRSNLKNKYKKEFLSLLAKYEVEPCKKFYLIVFYNTRHDTDNIVGFTKVFVDSMKDILIPDDGKKYYRGLCIFPDESLPKGHLEILIVRHGKED